MSYSIPSDNSHKGSLIYIIDDCGMQKLVLEKTLKQQGFRVRAFTKGFNLIQALDEECPDLIISDIDMPGIDGLELIQQVKDRQRCNDIPFWFLSSFNIISFKKNAKRLGAEKLITKPFSDKQLVADVRKRLQPMADVADNLAW